MSGKLDIPTNKYASIDETITQADGVVSLPFRVTSQLDIIRNDGPGEVAVTLDGGAVISLLAGDFVGPWANFYCSTITIQAMEADKSCRVRALGV